MAFPFATEVPVRDGAGKIVAVIDADISLQWLEKVIDESKVYKSTKRFLVTGSDHLLAGKETPIFHSAMKLVEAYAHKQGYEVIEDENGEMHHVFFHPVGGKTDWVLISILKDTEVFDQLRQVRIQQSMLPHDYQKVDDVDICGILLPAREVGGDLYDYFIRDEKLFFCIGDVSGKGAPAAMVMGVVHSLFRAFAAHETGAAHIMQGINEGTCQGNESNFFVTMFVGVLDLPTGHLRYCDAGHDAPIVLGKEQKRMLPCNPHLPVGVLDTIKYEEQETQLSPGDALFLYTDGLTEARNATNQLFGMNRVNVTLDKCFSLEPEEMLQRVIDDVRLYVTDAEQSDDLTLLALRYTPQSFESVISETLVIKNNVREMPKFGEFVKSMFGKMGLDKSMSRNIRLAVEEAVVNVMNYAYPAGEEGEIEIRLMSDGTVLRTVIIDSGVAFDPTIEKKADTSLPPEERQIGGLGILLYRELMDSINYEREGGKNILTLNKQL